MDNELEQAIRQIVREEIAASIADTSYEPTWTTVQVAEFLGLARQTVYNMVSQGEPGFPKPRKHGRLNAFIPSEIAAYRAEQLALTDK